MPSRPSLFSAPACIACGVYRLTAPEISPNAMMAHMDLKLDKILGILARQGTHPLDEAITYATDDGDWDR